LKIKGICGAFPILDNAIFRASKIKLIFQNNDQIKLTLMTTKCVHEAIENCTPEAVENFLANIKVDFENCLSDVSCIVFTVTMLVT